MNRSPHTLLSGSHKSQSGITLIEVLAAMLILAIGILALAPMMVLSVTGSRFSNDVTTLASAAQQRIEAEIARGKYPAMPYTQTETVDGKYEVQTDVRDNTVDGSIPDRVYEINVTVRWTDDTELARTMMFTTYATKK